MIFRNVYHWLAIRYHLSMVTPVPRAIRMWWLRRLMNWWSLKYRITVFLFKWVIDDEGDIGLQVFGCLTMLKYKQGTMFLWNKRYPEAPKRLYLKETGVADGKQF